MNWYQVDTINGYDNKTEQTDMIKATSIIDALKSYLKDDFADYKLTTTYPNGRKMVTAKCPRETANYYQVQKSLAQS